MNFIDCALSETESLTDDDFLQAMADIYQFPEVRERLSDYPEYVRDVIHIIDYDTELQMEGLFSAVCGSLHETWESVFHALLRCGLETEALLLKQAANLNPDGSGFQERLSHLQEQTALNQDYDAFWDRVRAYIGQNRR